MEPLWKLPPTDLAPAPDGGWCVQSEDGFGDALAVFVPLGKGGELSLADADLLPLTLVNDREWTPVPLHDVPAASHYLCLLRYDHPAEHPGGTFFRMKLASEAGPRLASGPVVAGSELREGLARMKEHLRDRFPLYLVPAPARTHTMAKAAADLPAKLSFAFASCQYPAGLLDRLVAHRSYQSLAEHVAAHGEPERLLLLGDQVYTDATYGLVDPARVDDRYRIPYEDFNDREGGPFSLLPQTLLARRRMTPDDHELRDNWEPTTLPDAPLDMGLAAFWKHQRRATAGKVQVTDEGPGWRLFMTDTRTRREPRNEDTVEQASILGADQQGELQAWLRTRPPGVLNIVTSAAMLLPRTRLYFDEPLYLDAWQGYPASFHGLLALLCEEEVGNLVFLSGDAHMACDARVRVSRPGSGKHASFASLHAPALYAPYPFANEEEANLLLQDSFEFQVGGRTYQCTVSAQVLAGGANGCGLLKATRKDARWCVGYEVIAPEAAA